MHMVLTPHCACQVCTCRYHKLLHGSGYVNAKCYVVPLVHHSKSLPPPLQEVLEVLMCCNMCLHLTAITCAQASAEVLRAVTDPVRRACKHISMHKVLASSDTDIVKCNVNMLRVTRPALVKPGQCSADV